MIDAELIREFFRQDAAYTHLSFKGQARLFTEWSESIGEPAEKRMCWFPWVPILVFMAVNAALLFWVREIAEFPLWAEMAIQFVALFSGIYLINRFFPRGRIVRKEKEAS